MKISKLLFCFGATSISGLAISVVVVEGYSKFNNYRGYCERTGRLLSTSERLNLAIENYLVNQRLVDLLEVAKIERKDRPSLDEIEKDFLLIPYKDKEEFFAVNEKCCELTWNLPEGGKLDYGNKVAGEGDGYFIFRHEVRYREKGVRDKSILSKNTYYSITNCEYAAGHYYYY